MGKRTRVLIVGVGGRDYHVFNACYRDDPSHEVVAFAGARLPRHARPSYPPHLSGSGYADGVPIVPESDLEVVVRANEVDEVIYARTDVSYAQMDAVARRTDGTGARFAPFAPSRCLLQSARPCVAVCSVRTGCGKSPVARHVVNVLRQRGLDPVVVAAPLPGLDLLGAVVRRFASPDDLRANGCTPEEVEEYEPHVREGTVVFAGTDYAKVLAAAEAEGTAVVWDGSDGDSPFVRPDVLITLLDPLRAGDEVSYFPGRWNLEHADILVLARADQARAADLGAVRESIAVYNPTASVIESRTRIRVSPVRRIRGRRVLVVEDGPTTTRGGLGHGAGYVAARRFGAAEIVDPRPFVRGRLAEAYHRFPHLRAVLPALGYGDESVAELEAAIDRVDCDTVVCATPIELTSLARIDRPSVQVHCAYEDITQPLLGDLVLERLGAHIPLRRSEPKPAH